MTKKKSKKKNKVKKQKIHERKDSHRPKEEQEKEKSPKSMIRLRKPGQDRVSDPVEPEIQRLAAEKTAAIASYIKDPDYRLRCKAAIDILMAKLKMINAELSGQKKRTVISQVTSRIKSAESIYAKLLKKGLEPDLRLPGKI